MSDELVVAEGQVIESTPAITDQVATGEEIVNQPPDPIAMKAEIERLEAIRKKAEEDSRYWRQEKAKSRADYFRSRGEEQKPPSPPVEDLGVGAPPSKENFDDYDKFLDAKISYETLKARIQWDREQTKKNAEEAQRQRISTLQEKINLGFQEFSDFEEVAMGETVPITPMIMDVLAETENAHRVAYYLGKNRAEAIQISRMTPIQAARAIAKIEMSIAKGEGLPVQKTTRAPEPIKPLGSIGPAGSKDPAEMTQREYEAYMESKGARRR
jgi:hypothetical protein